MGTETDEKASVLPDEKFLQTELGAVKTVCVVVATGFDAK